MMMNTMVGPGMSPVANFWACCDSTESACCCLGATFCPAIAYGVNYANATGNTENQCGACCTPCIMHTLADGVVSAAVNAIPGISDCARSTTVPLACCLRAQHRTAIIDSDQIRRGDEWVSCAGNALIEFFCWGCSAAQIYKTLHNRRALGLAPMEGNPIVGTLYPRNVQLMDNTTQPLLVSTMAHH